MKKNAFSDAAQGTPRREKSVFRALVVLGLVLVVFFGFRTVRSAVRVARAGLEPGTTNVESVRGWMTIPCIATAFDVPEEYLAGKLGLSGRDYRGRSLYRLNREIMPDRKGFVVETVKAALAGYLESRAKAGTP